LNRTLRLTSLMSDNEGFIFKAIVDYMKECSVGQVMVIDKPDWKERERQFDAGEIDIAWICGLPYILRADAPEPKIELLAAPVMKGARYRNEPVYYSDIVVRKDSRFRSFNDLKGASWAYNEPGSHSGYTVVKYFLATLGLNGDFFSRVVESGAHLRSLEMILNGEADASAIDSIVLEIETRRSNISSLLRTIGTIGPSPIPPLIISKQIPIEERKYLRDLLVKMEESPRGRALLEQGDMVRLAAVKDADYDAIRSMYRKGRKIVLLGHPT
jgi:phosphonate transport system substrate-binding protein